MRFLITPDTDKEYDDMVDWLYENTNGKFTILITASVQQPNTTFKRAYIVKFPNDIDPYVIPLFSLRWT